MEELTHEELEWCFGWFDAQYYVIYKKVKELSDDIQIIFKLFTPKNEVIETQTMDVCKLKKIGRDIEERHPNIKNIIKKMTN